MLTYTLLALACNSTEGSFENSGSGDETPDTALSGRPTDTGSDTDTDTGPETDSATPCEDCIVSEASIESPLDASSFITDTARTRANPLKGFLTSYTWSSPVTDFPDQLEFYYLPMADLWDETGETLDSGLEPHLVAAHERGHHAVVRVYIDYPNLDSGLPDYLNDLVDCEPHDHYGEGCSPDYDDPDLYEAMLGLISAMGERYDGDNRLGFVQVGLLGFWGEWHTYPYTEWFPSEETQAAILSTYDTAFTTTQVQVRTPAANSVDLRIGFHDDSFAYSTLGDVGWFFLPGLEAAGAAERWQEVAIGGELRPELQSSIFSEDYSVDLYAQDLTECIEDTHASYLLNYYAFNGDSHGYLGDERERAEQAALTMGYQFEIAGATLSASGLYQGTVEVSLAVTVSQTGVAPFYYPLFLSVTSEALPKAQWAEPDLSALLPGESQVLTIDMGRVSVDVMNAPLSLHLDSTVVQESQHVSLATTTPWTKESEPTTLQWQVRCEIEGTAAKPGEVVGSSEDGCDCTCDVDGNIRTCNGNLCD